ncbi:MULTISPECIES: YfiR family protein [unclassified Gilvimarinus]|uniref:YfiR family protein n=1 Tax=Gilvimarinus sp. DZF01 TaxID=3461371 RepID=UPI0040462821
MMQYWKWIHRAPNIACGRHLIVRLLLAALIIVSGSAAAAEMEASEDQVKAAMVYKILSYTSWPPTTLGDGQSPYHIWVLNAEEVADELQAIAESPRSGERPIRIHRARSPAQINDPHVIYVGHGSEEHLPAVRQLVQQYPLLIITESPRGLGRGSMINLRVVEGRIGFDVSLTQARESSLDISSRILPLALTVDQ